MNNDYKIKNETDDTAELMLYGIIGDYWDELDAKDIVSDIKKITAKNINVSIYSNGGSVFAGLAIYNALKEHSATVTVKIDSLAASIASIISMAGTVIMPENAFMMIHNPWTMAYGEETDMLKAAEVLAKIKESLIGVYKSKTNLPENEISDLMDFETWFTAQEAVDKGFADAVIDAVEPKNFTRSEVFNHCKNIPEQVLEIINKKPVISKGKKDGTVNISSFEINLAPAGEEHINHKKEENMAEITMETLKNDAPELLAEIKEESLSEGAKQERARIQAVLEQSMPGHDDLVQKLAFDGKTTGPEAAVQVLAAEKQVLAQKREDFNSDGIPPVNQPATPENQTSKTPQTKEEFEADKELYAEFSGDFEAYEAYLKATNTGLVRVLKNKGE